MKDKPKTAAVIYSEGGIWVPFDAHAAANFKHVHAIMFEDGSVWDAVTGWRDQLFCPVCMGTGKK